MCVKNIAFVQKVKGEYPNINFLTAAIGLKRFFGYEIVNFENVDEILSRVTKETIVFGGIPVMDKVFAHLGAKPMVPYYPAELESYLGRPVWLDTVANVRAKIEEGKEYFVKPLETMKKSFSGKVMSKFLDLLHMHHLKEDDLVWCSKPVEFISEYRFFVLGGKIVGCKHYSGDWKVTPRFWWVENMVEAYKSAPVAYSIDVGVTKENRTVIVECNDAISLGCYGLDPSLYGCMLVDRWKEIVSESK